MMKSIHQGIKKACPVLPFSNGTDPYKLNGGGSVTLGPTPPGIDLGVGSDFPLPLDAFFLPLFWVHTHNDYPSQISRLCSQTSCVISNPKLV